MDYYACIYADLEKLLVGCCALEFLERVLPERTPQEDWFHLLKGSLACLNQRREVGPFLWVFFSKALNLLGLQPQFGQCIYCRRRMGRSGVFGFSVTDGGVVCGACIGRGTATHRADSQTLLLLDKWATMPIEQGVSLAEGQDRSVRQAERILEAFVVYHLGREFRSLRVMREVLKTGEPKGER